MGIKLDSIQMLNTVLVQVYLIILYQLQMLNLNINVGVRGWIVKQTYISK